MNNSDRTLQAIQQRQFDCQQSEGSMLPYTFNYSAILGSDTISTSLWSSQGTAVLSSPTKTDTTTTVKVNGSPGLTKIVNTITTAAGITDERIINLRITSNQGYVVGDYE